MRPGSWETVRGRLEDGGNWFTINAEVEMLGFHVQRDSAPDSDQADYRATVSWSDQNWILDEWNTALYHQKVRLGAARAGLLTVDLGFDFVGHGFYTLRVDVLTNASPASSAVESAVAGEVARFEDY